MRKAKKKEERSQSSLVRLALLMKPYRWKMALCVFSVLFANAAQLVNPIISAAIIDDFLLGDKVQKGIYSIVGLTLVYFAIECAGCFATLYQVRTIARISQSILHTMRENVFSKIMHMSVSALDRHGTGRLITRSTNDVETVNEFYSDVFINLFKDVFMLLGIMVFMLALDWRLALIAFTAVPMIAGMSFSIKRIIKRNFKKIKLITGMINGFLAENIAGMRLVQAYNCQKQKLKEFDKLNKDYYKAAMTQVALNTVLRPSMEVINYLVIALLVAFGYHRIAGGVLKVGLLYSFTNYVKKFFDPVNDLAEKYTTVQSALVSVDRIYEVLDEKDCEYEDDGEHHGTVHGDVEFRDVWFAYNDENWVLKGVSFHIRAGEKAAFVGATGAGKSTIINLISRYYHIQKGQILLDGVDIEKWNLKDLREGVTTVQQSVFLFNGDIRQNIDMHSGFSDEHIIKSLHTAQADWFLDGTEGLALPVAEQGLNFSTGQRQLLSFARAVAADPGVIVLDEATAHIDSNTEELVQKSISALSADRTCIFIAHRLSTIRSCDLICVLENGVIAEAGTHDELFALGGIYTKLASAKMEEEAARLAQASGS